MYIVECTHPPGPTVNLVGFEHREIGMFHSHSKVSTCIVQVSSFGITLVLVVYYKYQGCIKQSVYGACIKVECYSTRFNTFFFLLLKWTTFQKVCVCVYQIDVFRYKKWAIVYIRTVQNSNFSVYMLVHTSTVCVLHTASGFFIEKKYKKILLVGKFQRKMLIRFNDY